LTFDGGFMDSSSSRTKCITERLKTSQATAVTFAHEQLKAVWSRRSEEPLRSRVSLLV
jgi:hypothetical protein